MRTNHQPSNYRVCEYFYEIPEGQFEAILFHFVVRFEGHPVTSVNRENALQIVL